MNKDNETFTCCGRVFTERADRMHRQLVHNEPDRNGLIWGPSPLAAFWARVSGAEFKRSVMAGRVLPGHDW